MKLCIMIPELKLFHLSRAFVDPKLSDLPKILRQSRLVSYSSDEQS